MSAVAHAGGKIVKFNYNNNNNNNNGKGKIQKTDSAALL